MDPARAGFRRPGRLLPPLYERWRRGGEGERHRGAARAFRLREPVGALGEGDLAHLLFRGFDGAAGVRFGARPDASLLRTLFPEQDFVVWRADAF